MMDSPFYGRSYWNLPSRSHPHFYYGPGVREIPVRFFGSEEKRPSRTDSAVKIQKVFRGFLVRKSVKKIKEIRSEVEEIEKRISKEETIDLIAMDSKERLRINEMLMSLLFRLDSVRGVDSGIRDCRKTVIQKAIMLQEIIEAVVSSNNNRNNQNSEKVVEAVGDQNQTAHVESKHDGEKTEAFDEKETNENQNDVEEKETVKNQHDNAEGQDFVEDYDVMLSVNDGPEESVGTSQTGSQADSSANPEACEEDEYSSPKQDNNATETHEQNRNNRERELLERMMEDNARMMDLMAQLFERNEMQTRLLSSLSQRVEQLERAFMCERLRKKKRNANGSC